MHYHAAAGPPCAVVVCSLVLACAFDHVAGQCTLAVIEGAPQRPVGWWGGGEEVSGWGQHHNHGGEGERGEKRGEHERRSECSVAYRVMLCPHSHPNL